MKSIDLDRRSVYEALLYMQTLLQTATCRFNPPSVHTSPKEKKKKKKPPPSSVTSSLPLWPVLLMIYVNILKFEGQIELRLLDVYDFCPGS